MKKIMLMIAFFAAATLGAQAQTESKTITRKIEVSGSAEKEITPDIIYFSISLKEYYDGKTKVNIDKLEKDLQKAVADAGIPKENFTINNIYGYNYSWNQKKDPNFEARKQYRLKLGDLNKINSILGKLDPKSIEYVNIDSYDHSRINEYKKELLVQALQASRDKATYLLAGIGEKCGSVLEIQESDGSNYPAPYMLKSQRVMAEANYDGGMQQDIDFKTIKLSYQVRAVYEIVK